MEKNRLEIIRERFEKEFGKLLSKIDNIYSPNNEVGSLKKGLADFYEKEITLLLNEVEEEIEKLKRTDETQMSHDHIYDEALSDVLQILKSKRNEK